MAIDLTTGTTTTGIPVDGTETMRVLMKAEPGPGLIETRAPVPRPGHGEVLVKVQATSICGTDLHIWDWDAWAAERIHPPLITGHEFCGHIVELGPDVTGLQVGDFISAETHIVCGFCKQCRTGQSHVCQNVKILGVDVNGCFAEYVKLPASNAWRNDPNLPPNVASILEPLGNAVHTCFAGGGGDLAGGTILVTGCGPIGLMAIGVTKASGATCVIATDVNEYRLGLARQMGADLTLNTRSGDPQEAIMNATGGDGADVLLEMSGHPAAIRQGLDALRCGGRVSMLGLPSKPIELDITNDIVFKGARIYGISGREMYASWYRSAELLRSGRLDLTPIVTHEFRLDDYAKAFELLKSGECGKVVLYP